MQTGFLIYAFFFNLFRVAFTPFLECAGEFRVCGRGQGTFEESFLNLQTFFRCFRLYFI